jgi:ribosomal protein L7/L12
VAQLESFGIFSQGAFMVKQILTKLIRKIIVLAVVVGVFLVIGYLLTDHKDYPGKAAFEEANKKITTNAEGAAHGNSEIAKAAAAKFALIIKPLQAALFTGGSGRSFASGGDFVTYCQHNAESVAFIVHVPELRNYKDAKAREALAQLAWTASRGAAKDLPFSSTNPSVIVGLRGFGSYGPIWSGKLGGEPEVKTDDLDEKRRLYPFFDSQGQSKPGLATNLAVMSNRVTPPGTGEASFDVVLISVAADRKISVIKALREVKPSLGLAAAKDIVESIPQPVLQGVPRTQADAASKVLEEAGAKVEIK